MRNKFKLWAVGAMTLVFSYCQREEEEVPQLREETVNAVVDTTKIVRLEDAKSLFERAEADKQRVNATRRGAPYITLEAGWSYFRQAKTLKDDEYAKVPVKVEGLPFRGEMLFLKKGKELKQYLFITEVHKLTNEGRIADAIFFLFDSRGVFISAKKMTGGRITHRLVPKGMGEYRLLRRPVNYMTMRRGVRDTLSGDGNEPGGSGIDFPPPANIPVCNSIVKSDYGGGDSSPIQLEPVTVYGNKEHNNNHSHSAPYIPYPVYNNPYNDWQHMQGENYNGGSSEEKGNSSSIGVDMAQEEDDTAADESQEDWKGGNKGRATEIKGLKKKPEDTIEDKLTNPCAKALLAQAPNLNNDIARLMRNTFGTSDKFNITVSNYSFGNTKTIAETDCRGSISGGVHELNCSITLNDDVINGASQEYILSTIYHEVIHAYLNVERQTLESVAFKRKYPFVKEQYLSIGGDPVRRYIFLEGHEEFTPFIENLARSVMSLPNTNISMEEAIAMAKSGVVERVSLSTREIYLDGEQKFGRSGTTCTPKTP